MMTRMLKRLRLPLVGVLAIGAIAVPAASAAVEHTFFATSAPVTLTGEQTGENAFKVGKVEVKCSTATPVGTIATETADEISLGFTLGGCKIGAQNVEVINEGCQLAVDSDTTVNPLTEKESAPGSLVCEAGKVLKVKGPACTSDVGSQGPLHGTTFTNVGTAPKEEVSASTHVAGVKFTATGFGCTLLGISPGFHEDGTLVINAKVQGYKVGQPHNVENQVGIGISTP